jgi:hypothetical protein
MAEKLYQFDEKESLSLTSSAVGVVLMLDGFKEEEVSSAGVELVQGLDTGQKAIAVELAGAIRCVADTLEKDERFNAALAKVKVQNEIGAYKLFRDVAWDVCFGSGGITWAKVTGLFVLAGKLAGKILRTFSSAVEMIRELMKLIFDWVCDFIRDYLWSWISDSGGWNGFKEAEEMKEREISSWKLSAAAVGFVGILIGLVCGYAVARYR